MSENNKEEKNVEETTNTNEEDCGELEQNKINPDNDEKENILNEDSKETPPKIPYDDTNKESNKSKFLNFFENRYLCIVLAFAVILLLFASINQSSQVDELNNEIEQLKTELDLVNSNYEELKKTPGVEIVAIRDAFSDENWDKVIELAENFEENHKDSKENEEAQDLKKQAQSKIDEITKQKEEEQKAREEQEKKEEAARAEAEQRQNEIQNASLAEKNALSTAQDYLSVMGFSRQGLKEQLLYEGYSDAEAEFALNHIVVDWNEQAAKVAKSYLDTMSFSRQGLLDQLLYEGFSQEQAEYGLSMVGY